MLIRYKDLVTLNLIATDGSSHRVQDVFMDERELRITHVAADLGGWFSDRKGVIGIGRFGQPDIASTSWPCELDEAALEDRIDRDPAASASRESATLAPSGATAAPHHLSEGGGNIRSVGKWTAHSEVHGSDGQFGTLMDAVFESKDCWQLRYLVVTTTVGGLPTHQRIFEADHLSSADFDAGKLTLNISRADAEKALDLHDLDDLESKWYNKVMAYYGLQS